VTYLRNHALRAVLLYHGIRREELCRPEGRGHSEPPGRSPLRLEDKREKIRYIPLAIVAQRLITAYLDAAKPGDETDGPLFRPVKNKATGTLAKPLHKSSVWDMVRLYTQQIDSAGTAPISPRCRRGWGRRIFRQRGCPTSEAVGGTVRL